MVVRRRTWALLVALVGCRAEPSDPAPPTCPSGTTAAFGACVAVLETCADADAVPRVGGGCARVGVDECGAGFVADGAGCKAVLPAGGCEGSEVAWPGEPACHALDECGSERFGAPAAGALHVDGSATAPFDGSEAHPFATLAEALALAIKGQTVRVAEGTYESGLTIGKGVAVRGRCSSRVTILAPDGAVGAILADGATLASVTVRGGALGLVASGSATLEAVLVQKSGAGIVATATFDARIVARRLVIEDTTGVGFELGGNVAELTELLVRRTGDAGLRATRTKEGRSVELTLSRAVFQANTEAAVYLRESRATLEHLIVEDTAGDGVINVGGPSAAPELSLRQSVLSRVSGDAVVGLRAPVALDRVTIRDSAAKKGLGNGVTGFFGATVRVARSSITGARYAGILGFGSPVTVRETVIADLLGAADGSGGYGVVVRVEDGAHPAPSLGVETTVVRRARGAGILASGANATISGSRIESTGALSSGLFGDGVQVAAYATATGWVEGSLALTHTLLTGHARAAVVSFGGTLTLEGARVACTPIPIDIEAFAVDDTGHKRAGPGANLLDRGGSACGCEALQACVAASASLEALAPPPPTR